MSHYFWLFADHCFFLFVVNTYSGSDFYWKPDLLDKQRSSICKYSRKQWYHSNYILQSSVATLFSFYKTHRYSFICSTFHFHSLFVIIERYLSAKQSLSFIIKCSLWVNRACSSFTDSIFQTLFLTTDLEFAAVFVEHHTDRQTFGTARMWLGIPGKSRRQGDLASPNKAPRPQIELWSIYRSEEFSSNFRMSTPPAQM